MSGATKDDKKAVARLRTLYHMAFSNRDLKFRYQANNNSGLFQVIAYDRGSAVVVDGIATRDMAELITELLTVAAAGTKQLDLLVGN